MTEITTIKILKETKDRLSNLKEHERETFNDVLRKILYILNVSKKNPIKAQKILINIDKRIKRREIMRRKINNFK